MPDTPPNDPSLRPGVKLSGTLGNELPSEEETPSDALNRYLRIACFGPTHADRLNAYLSVMPLVPVLFGLDESMNPVPGAEKAGDEVLQKAHLSLSSAIYFVEYHIKYSPELDSGDLQFLRHFATKARTVTQAVIEGTHTASALPGRKQGKLLRMKSSPA